MRRHWYGVWDAGPDEDEALALSLPVPYSLVRPWRRA